MINRFYFKPFLLFIIIFTILLLNLFERQTIITLQQYLGKDIAVDYIIKNNHQEYFSDDKNKINYLKLSFDFKPTADMNLDNLFQTADVNSGLRAELIGENGGLVVSDLTQGNLIRGFNFPLNSINKNAWHKLEIETISDKYIKAKLDDKKIVSTWWGYEPKFSIDRIKVGGGFDETREFHGEIKNITITTKNILSNTDATAIYVLFRFALLGIFIFLINITIWPKCKTYKIPKFSKIHDPLLILRSVACFMVLIGHGLLINFAPNNLPKLIIDSPLIGIFTSSPWGGVWIFFTLSGYLMGKAFFSGRYELNNSGILNFYRNRFLRIMPIYLFAVLIVFIFNKPQIFHGANFIDLVRVITVDDNGMLPITPIGALWSISTEVQFYILAPLLFWIFSWLNIVRYRLLFAFIIIILFEILFRIYSISFFGDEIWQFEVYKTLIGNLDLFITGFLTNFLVLNYKKKKLKSGYLLGYTFLFLLYILSSWISSKGMVLNVDFWNKFLFQYYPTILSLSVALIIFIFEISDNFHNPIVAKVGKNLEIFGLLTYAVYVWHEPIFNALAKIPSNGSGIFVSLHNILLALIPLFLVSYITWKYIEIPFEKKKEF